MPDDAPKHPVVDQVVDQLGPRSVERPGDAGCTAVGVLDDRRPARVDRAGLVQEWAAGWSLDWWIGAEDRWHFPARETTVRQRRIGAGPVLETAVRIPGGDAVHRTYRAMVRGSAVTVVEVENATATPVALALAARPYDLSGRSEAAPSAVRVEGDRLEIDDRVAVWLPRPPADLSVSCQDPIRVLQAGLGLDGASRAAGPSVQAVLVFPLPHRTTLRFVVASPTDSGPVDPGTVSDHETVARGWTSVVEGGGRFSLPDNGLSARAAAARARLLLDRPSPGLAATAEPGAGLVLEALAASGARHAVIEALEEFADSYPTRLASAADGAELAHALGWSAGAHGDAVRASSILEPLAQLTGLVERRGEVAATATALRGLGWACRAAGRPADAERLFTQAAATGASGPIRSKLVPLAEVHRQAESAGDTGAFGDDDLLAAARLWSAVRNLMLCETDTGIDMLAQFPTAWRGGGIEVHRAASPFGVLSYAVRWHGYRPALLWELEGASGPVELRCSGLDPDWSTGEPRGEALLAGTSGELPQAPAPGDSFL